MNRMPGGRESIEVERRKLQQDRIALMQKFEQMMLTDGWKEFAAYLEREVAAGEAALEHVSTGDGALRTLTALQTIKRLKNFPMQHVLNTRKELDEEAAQKR